MWFVIAGAVMVFGLTGMARKLRLESEGGIYHIINRGNYRASIFQQAQTKQAFLKCLEEACAKAGWRVHAWCVMSNHYHLAVETPQGNLVDGMRWLQGTWATRFNRSHGEAAVRFRAGTNRCMSNPGTPWPRWLITFT